MTARDVLVEFYRREGGWGKVTNRPSDRGGLTHSGITFKNLNRWRQTKGMVPLTEAEFAGLTREEADAFLTDAFLEPLEFVPNEHLRLFLQDFAMNAGPDDAIKALQTALFNVGVPIGAIDGVAGPKTRHGVEIAPDEQLERVMELVVEYRVMYHLMRAFDSHVRTFLDTHPTTNLHNLRGWIARTFQCAAS